MIEIVTVETAEHLKQLRELFLAYAATRPGDPALADFPEEIEKLPGKYAPPDGCMLIAYSEGRPAGCVALRKIGEGICEMKRLFVLPEGRTGGTGKILALEIIERGRRLGYDRMRLDTIPGMDHAQALYRKLGFREIPAYRYNPNPGTLFFELDLKE